MTFDEDLAFRQSDEQGEEYNARADVYRLLAALLASPPGEEVLRIIRNFEVPSAEDDNSLMNSWKMLKQVAEESQPEQLEDEYFNLFIGLGKGEISPYASWYLTGFLMEKPLAELRTELARLGFCRPEKVREPEDHAAALCEVMGVIIGDSVLSFEEEKAFYFRYISPWMARFFDDLNEAQSAKFYKPVARLGRQFIDIEQQYFSMSH
ncbi:MAG: molecular chaperone TorD family protein [Gammaproteobacteria bacterium]|nr:molecular chaperone TorD family protein [Gammaproteobacteria bacterium]